MKKRRKRYTWSFWKMHPVLQGMAIGFIGFATVGWIFAGIWFLWLIMM